MSKKPQKCSALIYNSGTRVAVIKNGSGDVIESFVKEVARVSGQPVDWHYSCGYAVVKAMGDIERVRVVLDNLSFTVHLEAP